VILHNLTKAVQTVVIVVVWKEFNRAVRFNHHTLQLKLKEVKVGVELVFCEQDMYPYAYRCLRRRYPRHDGWNIYAQYNGGTYRPDFVVERSSNGITEKVICEVKAENRVAQRHINQINEYVRKSAGRYVRIRRKILVIPYGVPHGHVPDNIEVIVLKSFGYVDD